MRDLQRANDPPEDAWVICQTDGVVESGHCTCMAGLGEVQYAHMLEQFFFI